MRSLLLTMCVALGMSATAQTWVYNKGGNDFDGNYRTAQVRGKGNDYPYTSPAIYVNKFDNGDINLYISGLGYVTDDFVLYFVFDGERTYKSASYLGELSKNSSSDVVFIKGASNSETLLPVTRAVLLDEIQKSSRMSVRFKTDYAKNDMSFPLSGSTKALNFVLGDSYVADKLAEEKREEEIQDSLRVEAQNHIFNIIESDSAWATFIPYSTRFDVFLDVCKHKGFDYEAVINDVKELHFWECYIYSFCLYVNEDNTYKGYDFKNSELIKIED